MFEYILADPVGLLVQLFFAATLVMMIRDAQKPPLITSIPTGLALMALSLSFNAPIVGVLGALNGVLWLIVAYQRYTQQR